MTITPYADTVRRNVKAELARRGVSQSSLSRQVGGSPQALARRMTGDIPFNVDDLARISNALGVPVEVLTQSGTALGVAS